METLKGNETFVLVHGAWHGAWCWEKTERLLHALGNKTIAIDLPAHGNNPGVIADQTLESYVSCIVEVLSRQEEPVILCGHSMGGVLISLAAERCPDKVKKLVYIAAFMLKDGQSAHGIDGTGVKPKDLYAFSQDKKTVGCTAETLKARYASHCSAQDQEYICANLCDEILEPLTAPIHVTDEKWGSIQRFYIAGKYDVALDPETVKKMLDAQPVRTVYELEGDHDLFYSAAEELAFAMHEIALKK